MWDPPRPGLEPVSPALAGGSLTAAPPGKPHFFFFLILFIYLFMAVLGLRFCARAFSSCGKRGPLFIAVRGPLIITASLVAEHRLQMRRLSNCGSRAQLLRGMWDPPRTGLEPVSPALAGRFSTTASRGKPREAPFLMLNNASIYKYTSDCLSKLLKRDFWVVSYDLSDRGYLKCVEFCLMD